MQVLQQENDQKDEQIHTLQTINKQLETARNKFVQLHTDVKNEKKELQEKYDHSQQAHHTEIKKYMVWLHLAIGLTSILLTILLILQWGVFGMN